MNTPLSGIESWAAFLADRELPVLRHTAHALLAARERMDRIDVRELADIVLHDPMMTARVLRFSAAHRGRRQLQDMSTVEHAVMMLGVEPFFRHFAEFELIENHMNPQALLGLLHVVRRAQRASHYALEWAVWRCDLNSEEVAIAALLHDLAEMLLWCWAPEAALKVQALQHADPALRSADAQTAVLGFPLNALQALVCRNWELPELLLTLMDDTCCEKPRVKNVKLAVDLARHSAHGWDDPALPDDFRAIARLMNVDEDSVRVRLGLLAAEREEKDN
ncbi:HDOD domain-containing protein [Noviherbaspirillum sp.]|uniref:HDOD domain-containing protein n=1 Tax=Noviherbaspirillum sp. TaxID=1926288 RepID=UPI002D24A894|nr:HDOD domain-containing protein [Noviherbaspirillum sp.]HZW20967.1 HDOD domain-containing protein [Noviherbaspirillum sp.]